jgi:hypothetical protein
MTTILLFVLIAILSISIVIWGVLLTQSGTRNKKYSQGNTNVTSELNHDFQIFKSDTKANVSDLVQRIDTDNAEQDMNRGKLSKRIYVNNKYLNDVVNMTRSIPGIMVGSSVLKTTGAGGNLLFQGPNNLLIDGFKSFKVGDSMSIDTASRTTTINGSLIVNDANIETSISDLKAYDRNIENSITDLKAYDTNIENSITDLKDYIDTRVDSLVHTYQMSKSLSNPYIDEEVIESFVDKENVTEKNTLNNIRNKVVMQVNTELKPILDTRERIVQEAMIKYINSTVSNATSNINEENLSARTLMDQVTNQSDKAIIDKINVLDTKYTDDLKTINDVVSTMLNKNTVHLSKNEMLEGKIEGIQGQMGDIIGNAQKIADAANNNDTSAMLNMDVTGTFSASGPAKFKSGASFDGDVVTSGNIHLNKPGMAIHAGGRMHIQTAEALMMMSAGGVNVSTAWGGNGALKVDKTLTVGEKICINTTCIDENTLKSFNDEKQ